MPQITIVALRFDTGRKEKPGPIPGCGGTAHDVKLFYTSKENPIVFYFLFSKRGEMTNKWLKTTKNKDGNLVKVGHLSISLTRKENRYISSTALLQQGATLARFLKEKKNLKLTRFDDKFNDPCFTSNSMRTFNR